MVKTVFNIDHWITVEWTGDWSHSLVALNVTARALAFIVEHMFYLSRGETAAISL